MKKHISPLYVKKKKNTPQQPTKENSEVYS